MSLTSDQLTEVCESLNAATRDLEAIKKQLKAPQKKRREALKLIRKHMQAAGVDELRINDFTFRFNEEPKTKLTMENLTACLGAAAAAQYAERYTAISRCFKVDC